MNFKCPLIINRFFQKKGRVKLRLINRGYKKLQNSNRLGLIIQLGDALAKTELKGVKIHNIFFGKNSLDIELSVRQYLTVRILGMSFNKEILYSIGAEKPIRHPLPREWRNTLISKKIKVDNFSCALLWYGHIFLLWGYGALQWLKSFWGMLYRHPNLGNYIYFHSLSKNNISYDTKDQNIVNWYLQWKNKNKNIDSICHSINGLSNFKYNELSIVNTDGLPKLKGRQMVYYCIWSMCLITYSFFMILVRPYYGLMLGEILKLVRTSFADKDQLASDYLFHNSEPFYRPMWTYEVQKRGSRVLFYFYSTNIEIFKTTSGYPVQNPWHLISWPYYLVWDEFQVDFIQRFNRCNSTIEKVGPIWFSSNDVSVNMPLNSIAVFDVVPRRWTGYISYGFSFDYYVPNIANQFLNDIQVILSKNNAHMVHKIKRVIKTTHKKYTMNLRGLSCMPNYTGVSPKTDALQVIQKTKACISIPFTSTAIIAKQEGKPSVYYDPSGMIQKDDRAAHGIPVLNGINELEDWISSL